MSRSGPPSNDPPVQDWYESIIAVGDNEPYAGRDNYGYTMEHHVVAEGLPQVLLELRQDLIDTHHGIEAWVEILGPALEKILDNPDLYRQEWFA